MAVSLIGYVNSGCVSLVVWSSNEKADLLVEIADEYNAGGPMVDRRCVRVEVVKKASGDAELALTRPENEIPQRPDVWWPAAKTWVLLLQHHRAKLPSIVPAVYASLIQSPLVIAMPQQAAQALKDKGEVAGWGSILKLAQDPEGWARYGKPWGRFRLGKTNPTISTSGLHALIGTYNAATHKTDPLTVEDIRRNDAQSFVKGVESSVVHYGHTVETFLTNLWNADDAGDALSYVSAVAVEEKQAFDYNRGNPASDLCPSSQCPRLAPKEKLVALYPAEGTLMADHPYVVLDWSHTDAEHRQAALDFRGHLETRAVQDGFLLEGFRGPDGQPGVGVLPESNFRRQLGLILPPPDPAVLAEIQGSWSALRKRANLLIAIDVGQSMRDIVPDQNLSKLELAKHAAKEALTLLEDDDEVGLWTFSTRAEGDRAYREILPIARLGADRRLLELRIDALETETGKRQLFSAVLSGVEYVRSRLEPDRINAMVVLSNGLDEGSQVDFYDLVSRLRKQPNDARVRVFTIAYSAFSGALRQIAEASPGAFYDAYPEASTIKKVLRDVISNF